MKGTSVRSCVEKMALALLDVVYEKNKLSPSHDYSARFVGL